MKKLFLILLLISVSLTSTYSQRIGVGIGTIIRDLFDRDVPIDATIFYISNAGDDAATGLLGTPWETISKVNGETFDPGNQILFNRGDTWRESLTIPSSGTEGNHITFGAYGSGDDPKFYGSILLDTWTQLGGTDVWYQTKPTADMADPLGGIGTHYSNVFFVESGVVTWGSGDTASKAGQQDLVEYYDWFYATQAVTDTFYIWWDSDPNVAGVTVEVPQQQNIIEINAKEYLTFDGLEVRYAAVAGFRGTYPGSDLSGLTVQNCDIGWYGLADASAAFCLHVWHSDMNILNNEIRYGGRRGLSINLDNSTTITTLSNITVSGNLFSGGFHTTGVDVGNNSNSMVLDGLYIFNNIFEDDPTETLDSPDGGQANSNFIFNGAGGGVIQNVDFYNNLIKYTKKYDIQVQNVDTIRIFNNSFYGFNENIIAETDGIHIRIAATIDSVEILNNISYKDIDDNTAYALFIDPGGDDHANIDYNLYYSEFPARANWGKGGVGTWAYTDFATYQSATGADDNGITADPLFNNPPDSLFLRGNSSGVGAGVDITGYTTDFLGVSVSSPPNIGAIEDTITREVAGSALTTDLVAYYNFNEASGNLLDQTANGNNGTNNGCEYGATGILGDAWTFVATNTDYIDCGSDFDLILDSLTYAVWVKTTDNTLEQYIVGGGTAGNGFPYLFIRADNRFQFGATGGVVIGITSATVVRDGWHFIAVTYSTVTDDCKWYIDGSFLETDNVDASFSDKPLVIGTRLISNKWFNGDIDEFGIWGRILTADEITELWNSGSGITYPFSCPLPVFILLLFIYIGNRRKFNQIKI